MSQSTPPPAYGQAPPQPQPGYGYPPQPGQPPGPPQAWPQQAQAQPQFVEYQAAPPQFAQQPPQFGQQTQPNAAGFSGALAAEWTKIWSVRSTVWSIAVLVLVMLGIDCTLPLVEMGKTGVPNSDYVQMMFAGSVLGMVVVVPLSALSITAEYSTGMIRTTFIAAPRRLRVLLAKLLVLTALLFALSLACATIGLLVAHTELPGDTVGDVPDSTSLQIHATLGVAGLITLVGLLTFGLGALLRSSAGTITLILGLIFVPFVVGIIASGYAWGQKLVQYSLISAMTSQFSDTFFHGGPSALAMVALLAVLAAAVVAAGAALTASRDA